MCSFTVAAQKHMALVLGSMTHILYGVTIPFYLKLVLQLMLFWLFIQCLFGGLLICNQTFASSVVTNYVNVRLFIFVW